MASPNLTYTREGSFGRTNGETNCSFELPPCEMDDKKASQDVNGEKTHKQSDKEFVVMLRINPKNAMTSEDSED